MSFLTEIDPSFLDEIDLAEFDRQQALDDLVIDLCNYIKNVDCCDEVRMRRRFETDNGKN